MKKVYIIPNTLVVKVETQQMIAESMNKDSVNTKSFGSSLSREGNSSWDDED